MRILRAFVLALPFLALGCTGDPDVHCFGEQPRSRLTGVALPQSSTTICPDANGPGASVSHNNNGALGTGGTSGLADPQAKR